MISKDFILHSTKIISSLVPPKITSCIFCKSFLFSIYLNFTKISYLRNNTDPQTSAKCVDLPQEESNGQKLQPILHLDAKAFSEITDNKIDWDKTSFKIPSIEGYRVIDVEKTEQSLDILIKFKNIL